MSTSKRIKSLVKYNIIFLKEKILHIIPVIIVMNSICIFVGTSRFNDSTSLIINCLGGVDSKNINLFNFLIAIFPYLILAMILECYIGDMFEKQFMQVLIRSDNKRTQYISTFITIILTIGIILIVLDGTIISIVSIINIINPSKMEYNLSLIWIIKVFFVQYIGTYLISLIQLLINKIFHGSFNGFIVILIIYCLNSGRDLIIGSHIIISKINMKSTYKEAISIIEYLKINCILIIIIMCILLSWNSIRGRRMVDG